jgi:CheY-like chemotaxis protein
MINYLYLDDFANPNKKDDYHKVNQIANSFRLEGELNVILEQPIDWKFQLKNLAYIFGIKGSKVPESEECLIQLNVLKEKLELKDISELKNSFSGIILDLRLDEKLDVGYKGTTVAQEIRQRATHKSMKDIPIVLCTGNNIYKSFYRKDSTTHDLFDITYIKDDIEARNKETKEYVAAKQLISLANGYESITDNLRSVKKILKVTKTHFIDSRVIEQLESYYHEKKAIHVYTRFILNELVRKTGVLISEPILAARLGIEIPKKESEKNYSEWRKLKTELEKHAYSGVFNDFSKLWWSNSILDWWDEKFKVQPLVHYNAEERVEIINKTLKLELQPFKSKETYHQYYWTICCKSLIPLDIRDGLIVNTKKMYPWQDTEYVSKDYALKKNIALNEISPLDRDKFEYLKKVYFSNKERPSRKKR